MVDSMSDAIITDPQTVIEKLFNERKDDDLSKDFNVPKAFQDAFVDTAQFDKIPQLDELSPNSLKTGKLIRFLGMVQDTSYSQEIYIGMLKRGKKWELHRYREAAQVDDVDFNSPDIKLDERHGVYVTSIPGCTRWFERSDSISSLSLEESKLYGEKERIVMYNQQKGMGVVVKCYCGAENKLRVCDLVEIIGILEMPEEASEDDHNEMVIHAVTIQPRQLNNVVLGKCGSLSSADIAKARDVLLNHVTDILAGDKLAAKSVLLNLTSSLTHRNPTPLGQIPLNIYSTSSEIITDLTLFIRSVLPAVAYESISIDNLNSTRLYAKSDGEQFSAGRGQFVPRTAMILDETSMKEGKLLDTGVRNLRFLNRIIVAQKLSFEFPYHEFEIDTELSVLVLGETKSILPVTVAFPLVKENASRTKPSLRIDDLMLLRKYFATVAKSNITIPESIAEEMQISFIQQRKEHGNEGVNEDWFGKRIIVAKGLARIGGREMVSREDWLDSLEICSQWESRRK